jgi:general secretion pathway protein D
VIKVKQLKLVVLIAAIVAGTAFITWQAVTYVPKVKVPEKAVRPESAVEANEPAKPSEANEPAKAEAEKAAEPNEAVEPNKPPEPNEPNKPAEPNDPMESLNLKDVEMKDIVQKLAEWTGKSIIPVDDAMEQKITIYAPEKLPRSKALLLIYSALREKGIVADPQDNSIILRPIKDAKLRAVPTVPDDMPLAAIRNRDEIVEKFFKLTNCSPTQLQKVVKPLMPEHGYCYAVESTGHLVAIDTVANLLRIQRIIEQLDVEVTKETVIETFIIRQADPVEIVQLLNILLGDAQLGQPRRDSRRGGRDRGRERRSEEGGQEEGGAAASVVIASSEAPMTLIPLTERKWIIAKASAEDMIQIEQWITKLDERKPEEREYSLCDVNYVDVMELAEQITNMIESMPLRANVAVQPLRRAKKIMIIGSEQNREMVEKLIYDVDFPTEQFEMERFKLTYAEAEMVKQTIEELFMDVESWEYHSRWGSYRGRYRESRELSDPDMVRVIAHVTQNAVTVVASPDNMEKVAAHIAELDQAIDVNDVAPCIIQLQNTDPVHMEELLSTLFTETQRERSWLDMWLGRGGVTRTIVGPLYGKMAFKAVEDTRKLIVVSKVPEGYEVVKRLVAELDRQESPEVPFVKVLRYADPEDLCERLNAIFNEPGTPAVIRRTARGLSEYSMEEGEQQSNQNQQDTGGANEYTPPWSAGGARPRPGEMPISRVIGRIRFIPEPHSKAILVLTPSEYVADVNAMIEELDQPGRQVKIRGIVVSVDHRDLTSLGLQLATDPLAFGTLDEDAITALTELTLIEERGSLTISASTSINALIDFLVKKVDAKILNQQTLWTKDNEEADFFRGEKVAFNTDISVSGTGERVTSGIDFQRVGMTLRVRPVITPEKSVDMRINVIVSQRTAEFVNDQPVRDEMDAETAMIVQDGETLLLGGMLLQEDSTVERKIPLFGDLPLLGGIFRHNEIALVNRELLVFVTPYVIDEDPSKMRAETLEEIEDEREKLKTVLTELQATLGGAGL